MNDLINMHDIWHLVGLAVVVAVLKTDMVWLKKWAREHEKFDAERFHEINENSRSQDNRVNNSLNALNIGLAVVKTKMGLKSSEDTGSFKG